MGGNQLASLALTEVQELVTQKQEEEEEEEQEAGSLLDSKQEKLQWSVEAGRLGGTQEMTGTVQLTAVTQKHNYTLYTLKRKRKGVSLSTHL